MKTPAIFYIEILNYLKNCDKINENERVTP
jgi:hypothetical protein